MAKKRINKKILIILLLIGLPIVILLGIWMDTRRPWLPAPIQKMLGHDPQENLARARKLSEDYWKVEEEVQAELSQISDFYQYRRRQEELEEKERKPRKIEIIKNLNAAERYGRKNKSLRTEVLFELAEFHYALRDYKTALGAWSEIYKQDSTNYRAKRKILDFQYERATIGGHPRDWSEVLRDSDILIKLQPDDVYAYVVKAHAALSLLKIGATESPQTMQDMVQQLLTKAMELDDKNVQAYDLLAKLAQYRIDKSEGDIQRTKWEKEAEGYLRKAVEKNGDDPEAVLNLVEGCLLLKANNLLRQSRTETNQEKKKQLILQAQEYIDKSLAELDTALERFPEADRLYATKARVLRSQVKERTDYDAILKLYEKAIECEPSEGYWYASLVESYFHRAEFAEMTKEELSALFLLLQKAICLPSLNDMEGPTWAKVHRLRYGGMNKISNFYQPGMIPMLIDICVWRAGRAEEEGLKKQCLQLAGDVLKELVDASGVHLVIKKVSAGTLALANGEITRGLKDLYEADQRDEAVGLLRSQLKMKLFRALRQAGHKSMAADYAFEGLQIGRRSARDFVESMETLQELPGIYRLRQLELVHDAYNKIFSEKNLYSQRVMIIQMKILLAQQKYEEAGKIAKKLQGDSEEAAFLRARAHKTPEERMAALQELARQKPGNSEVVNILFNYYTERGKDDPGNYDRARNLLAKALEADPKNIYFQQMHMMLNEPDPSLITPERKNEIVKTVLEQIDDSFDKSKQLGDYYLAMSKVNNEDEAEKNERLAYQYYSQAASLKPDEPELQDRIFSLYLTLEEWDKAKEFVAQKSREKPLDGLMYDAQLALVLKQWNKAAENLENYLKESPISVSAHLRLAQAYNNMKDRANDALEQVRLAVSQDRNNVPANIQLAKLLHEENRKTGTENLTSDQISQILGVTGTILAADSTNIMACRLQVSYGLLWIKYQGGRLKESGLSQAARNNIAQSMVDRHNLTVRTCRHLISLDPENAANWQLLAESVYEFSRNVTNPDQKKELEGQAEKAYLDGIKSLPKSVGLRAAYSSFLRKIGQEAESDKSLKEMIAAADGPEKQQARLMLSRLHISRGEFSKAKKLLEEILQDDPGNQSAQVTLAELSFQRGDYENALRLYERIRQEKDEYLLMARHIEVCQLIGQKEKAETLLGEIDKKFPEESGNITSGLLRGNQFLINQNYREAENQADTVLSGDANNKLAHLLKCKALYLSGKSELDTIKLQRAEDGINRLRGIYPDDHNLGRILLSRIHWAMSRYDDAIRDLEAILRISPGHMEARMILVQSLKFRSRWNDLRRYYQIWVKDNSSVSLCMEAGRNLWEIGDWYKQRGEKDQMTRNYTQALDYMRQGWKMSRESNDQKKKCLETFARALLEIKGHEKEVEKLISENLTNSRGDAALLLYQMVALKRLGRKDDAFAAFEKVLQYDTYDFNLTDMVIRYASSLGETDEMISWCKKKLSSQPEWPVMHMVLAEMYRKQNDRNRMIAQYHLAQKNADKKMASLVEKYLAAAYLSAGIYDKAIDSYRKVVAQEPDDYLSLNNLSYILMETNGDIDEALKMAHKAYSLAPSNTNVMDTYALALLKNKEYSRAEKILRQAIRNLRHKSEEISPYFLKHWAQSLQGLGRREDARKQFLEAKKKFEKMKGSESAGQLKEINMYLENLDK